MRQHDVETMLDEIVTILAQDYEPEQIILFGSYAYGRPDKASDIDLLIVKQDGDTPYQRAVRVRRMLRNPQRRIPIELLVLTPQEVHERLAIGDQFFQEIYSRGRVLYETERVLLSS
jgi:uncharacterized protein